MPNLILIIFNNDSTDSSFSTEKKKEYQKCFSCFDIDNVGV